KPSPRECEFMSVRCAILFVLATTVRGWATILPSFWLEDCAWNATEIVVAKQGETSCTILETWRGGLAKGDQIKVIDLPVAPLRVSDDWSNRPMGKMISGKRVVLYLKPGEPTAASKRVE